MGNTPPRSGNVNRFLSYVKTEYEKMQSAGNGDAVILKKIENMLIETRKFMKNPKHNKPNVHPLVPSSSSNSACRRRSASKVDKEEGDSGSSHDTKQRNQSKNDDSKVKEIN
uniref:Endoplasmic reticulum metallopeptidase 1 n=1 Tax=Lygus hesperus TaxID=30085 RepID=A0A0A9YTE3_LYGHE